MRFWSTDPPRTLNPDDASPTVCTPGSASTALMISASPKAVGILRRRSAWIFSTPMLVVLCRDTLSADIVAAFSEMAFSVISTSSPPSPNTFTSRLMSSIG